MNRRGSLSGHIEDAAVEGHLAFFEQLLTNAARLWMAVGLDQKQQLQQGLFPEGLQFVERFGPL